MTETVHSVWKRWERSRLLTRRGTDEKKEDERTEWVELWGKRRREDR